MDKTFKFKQLKEGLISSLVAVSNASKFLKPSEVIFLRSDLSVSKKFDSLAAKSVHWINATANIGKEDEVFAIAKGNVDEDFTRIVDLMDDFYERADMHLDTAVAKKKAKKSSSSQVPLVSALAAPFSSSPIHQSSSKPQLQFKDKVDNSNNPWVPIIKFKPNAKQSLGASELPLEIRNHLSSLGHSTPAHPYKSEIESITYPAELYVTRAAINYGTLEETSLTWIDTLASLQAMVKKLNSVKEIAVDLEHHDYRSFQGFTCLIQISTRSEDFIIDALKLRHELYLLNEPFTNPSIIKVFHGAEMDIIWLQRDFGVYIVGLFDSFHASHCLEMPKHSFAYLLENYCGIHADKQYQRADWRQRPLSSEMINYARSDTHYLLYIYDMMRNEMAERSENLIRVALERSSETSLKTYQKPVYDAETGEGPGGWKNLLRRHPEALNEESFAVFRAIHGWRDHIARSEDESPAYVMPNHIIFKLSRYMPTTAKAVINGSAPVPPLTRVHAPEIAKLIEQTLKSVREKIGNNTASLMEVTGEASARETHSHLLDVGDFPRPRIFSTKILNQQASSRVFGGLYDEDDQPSGLLLAAEVVGELKLVAPTLAQEATIILPPITIEEAPPVALKKPENQIITMKETPGEKRPANDQDESFEITAIPISAKKLKVFDFSQAQEEIEKKAAASKKKRVKKEFDPMKAQSSSFARVGKKSKGKGRSGKI